MRYTDNRTTASKDSVPPIVATISTLAREIEADPTRSLSLTDLARRSGYSPAYLQRKFKAVTGSSPKAFHMAARMRHLRRGLRSGASVTAAIAAAGFGSTSRVYERADAELGMTPVAYRERGRGITIGYASASTPLGRVLIGATERGICALAFGSSERALLRDLRSEFPEAMLRRMPREERPEFARWIAALRDYLEGRSIAHELPLDLRGTAFQLLVWRYLRSIPHGSVRSYAEVARAIGRPGASRAVARACASNRIAVLVPCHRVVRGTGELSGYRWGARRKRALLTAEGTSLAR